MSFDIDKIRADFPILQQTVYGKPLVYLDNGATTQKPNIVIDRISDFYRTTNANVHRGVHFLSDKSTQEYESSRDFVAQFLNASNSKEIIFTKGATDSINLIADAFTQSILKKGDQIIVSALEHHANLVPWQIACQKTGAELKIIPINEKGELIQSEFENLLSDKVKIFSIAHVSNSLGTINPVKEMIAKAHQFNIPVLLDASQSVQHIEVDVQDLDCEFLAFSGHKIYAPTGIGALYGKTEWLEKLPPYQSGGDMIDQVSYISSTYAEIPLKFEAGTNNYVGAIALAEALKYVQNIGLKNIANYESELLNYATQKLNEIEALKIIGTADKKASALSFIMDKIHNYDLGMILDKMGIAVRTGHHCTQPLMNKLGINGTVRASFAIYNTKEEVDKLTNALLKAQQMFS
ncbi:MAG: cysteine desulfurase [Bacteroidales bacterium]|nr:cysteine desulfurase [Bacteroidales bacterium]